MPKHIKSSHRSSHRSSRKSPPNLGAILRRPIVQIGILVLAAALIYLIAVTANRDIASSGLPAEVDVDTAYAMYQEGAFILDVREQSEWDEYHAPGATLIPLGELPSRLNELPRGRQIVVVCHSGGRSQEGRDILLKAGFTQVTSMSGGLSAWRTAGYPIEP
jgi:rhodanese-related sulfurtransferase